MSNPKPVPTCPDCGGERIERVGALPDVAYFSGRPLGAPLPGGSLMHCQTCDLRFRWPQLPDYDRLYDNAAVDAWEIGPLRKDQRLVQAALATRPHARSLLDFGCYSGGFLAGVPPHFARYGVEVASAAAAVAARESGATVRPSLEQFPAELKFDVIVSMDVIEHVRSPRALLAAWLERLAPGGLLVITTGDGAHPLWRLVGARWWYCYYPEHIAFISTRWLHCHAAALGARIEGIESFNYLDDPAANAGDRWTAWLKYLLRPAHHARKRARVMREQGRDAGVPGMGLARDHLLVLLAK